MNKETFEKAKSLNKQIEKLENHIYAINGTIITGNSILKRDTKVGFFAKFFVAIFKFSLLFNLAI